MSGRIATIAGLVLAALGIAVPLALWLVDSDSNEIEVRIVSKANLDPSLPSGVKGAMEVSIGGVKVTRPYYVVIEVANSGNRSVTAEDVEIPLTIDVGNVVIAQAQILRVEPAALAPVVERQDRHVVVRPLLLNPGDSFQLGLLTSGSEPVVSVRARIAGIKDVRIVSSADEGMTFWRSFKLGLGLLLVCLYASLLMMGIGQWRSEFQKFEIHRLAIFPMAICCALAGISIFYDGLGTPPAMDWKTAVSTFGMIVLGASLARLPLKEISE